MHNSVKDYTLYIVLCDKFRTMQLLEIKKNV